MDIKAFRIMEDRHLAGIEPESLEPGWHEDGVLRWVDLSNSEPDELNAFLEPLDLHPLVLKCCQAEKKGLRLAPFRKALFCSIPVQHYRLATERRYLAIICTFNTLITIRFGKIPSMDKLSSAMMGNVSLFAPSTAAMMYHVVENLVDQTVNHVLRARGIVSDLADKVTRTPDQVQGANILALKRLVSHLAITGEDQLYGVNGLQTADTDAFGKEEVRDYLRDLSGSLDYVMRSIARLDDRLTDLHHFVNLTLSNKSEGRLRFLTIISAVFLPLTLIAGVYGMNFEHIPELSIPGGYFWALGFMLATGAGMLWYFHKKGWFE